jgi:hypothetical protein
MNKLIGKLILGFMIMESVVAVISKVAYFVVEWLFPVECGLSFVILGCFGNGFLVEIYGGIVAIALAIAYIPFSLIKLILEYKKLKNEAQSVPSYGAESGQDISTLGIEIIYWLFVITIPGFVIANFLTLEKNIIHILPISMLLIFVIGSILFWKNIRPKAFRTVIFAAFSFFVILGYEIIMMWFK